MTSQMTFFSRKIVWLEKKALISRQVCRKASRLLAANTLSGFDNCMVRKCKSCRMPLNKKCKAIWNMDCFVRLNWSNIHNRTQVLPF